MAALLPFPLDTDTAAELTSFVGENTQAIVETFKGYEIAEEPTTDALLLASFRYKGFAEDLADTVAHLNGEFEMEHLSSEDRTKRRQKIKGLLNKGLASLKNAGEVASVAEAFLQKGKNQGGGGTDDAPNTIPPPAEKPSMFTPSVKIALGVLGGLILLFVAIKLLKK